MPNRRTTSSSAGRRPTEDVRAFTALGGRSYATYGMPETVFSEVITRPERVLASGMGTILASIDGELVACAQYLLSHGIGGVYWVATDPDHRGRGLGELVTRVVTNEAFDRGASVVTLQASPMGEPIYQRMGYETVYRYRSFMWAPDQD